jgi:lysophospholipase L1-like esterase
MSSLLLFPTKHRRIPAWVTRTLVIIGDSITEYNGPALSGSSWYTNARGYFTMANALMGQRFKILSNLAVGGYHLNEAGETDILGTVPAAIALAPDYVMFMGGINDVDTTEDTAATIEANWQAVVEALVAAGIKVVTSTITSSSATTEARRDVRDAVNTWITAYCAAHPDIVCADLGAVVTDPATRQPRALYNESDGSHPLPYGAYRMGAAIASRFTAIPPKERYFGTRNPDTILNANPTMTGDVSGLATGFTQSGTPTPTPSKVARTDGCPGQWQQLVVGTRGAANFQLLGPTFTGAFAPGDTVYAQAEIMLENLSDLKLIYLGLTAQDAAYAALLTAYSPYATDATADMDPPAGFTAVLRTPNMVLPANTARLRHRVVHNGVYTLKVGQYEVRKVV